MLERILVYGVTGSGKTTLARQIAQKTDLPWYEVDQLTWLPGWVEVPRDEQREMMAGICAENRWVLDTAYSHWSDVPLSRAELIVALDYPRWVSLTRLLRRTVARNVDKRLVCGGNTETWRNTFSRDSIIRWHFRSFARKRERIRRWAADPAVPEVLVMRSPKETDRWLRELRP